MTINLKIPDAMSELKPRITVFGVGGAGGNAVNNMIQEGLDGVEFVVANTDAQAIAMSSAERRIQMGTDLTEGLGAGSQPKIGAAAAQEAQAEILDYSSGSHMVFITAGMGGGTGTGAAPVIAQLCKEQDILTVAVVTKPFQFEGARRMQIAEEGIEELNKYVDTLIVIPNQNLFRVANEKTTFSDAFAMADQVLLSGVSGITDLMVKEGLINLDFADVKSIMHGMGKAMMGTGEASGEKRAVEAAEAAISNPLLDDVSMKGAQGLLISITGGEDLTLYEVDEVATRIRNEVDSNANIILGATFDPNLEGSIKVSVVATGIRVNVKNTDGSDYTINHNYTYSNNGNIDKKKISSIDSQKNPLKASESHDTKESQSMEKNIKGDISIKKLNSGDSFFAVQAGNKVDKNTGQQMTKDNNFLPKEPDASVLENNDIPRVSDFFSLKDENITMPMNESLLDKKSNKEKIGFFSKLVGVGRKKNIEEDNTPLTENSYSDIKMPREDELELGQADKEDNSMGLDHDAASSQSNVEEDILNQEFQADDQMDIENIKNEINTEQINEEDGSADIHQNDEMDDLLNSIDLEQTEEKKDDSEDSINNDSDLEIPSFLKRQAN